MRIVTLTALRAGPAVFADRTLDLGHFSRCYTNLLTHPRHLLLIVSRCRRRLHNMHTLLGTRRCARSRRDIVWLRLRYEKRHILAESVIGDEMGVGQGLVGHW